MPSPCCGSSVLDILIMKTASPYTTGRQLALESSPDYNLAITPLAGGKIHSLVFILVSHTLCSKDEEMVV